MTRPRRVRPATAWRAGLGLCVAAAAGWLLAPQASATTWQGRVVLDQGHVDAFHVTLDGDRLALGLREDWTGDHVEHEADDVVIHLSDAGILEVPEGLPPEYAFLGDPGARLWLIPEVQNPDVVWAGWNTEEVPVGRLADDRLTLTITSVDNLSGGRDDLIMWDSRADGLPRMIVDTTVGDRDITVSPRTHAHANWAFFDPGVYELDVEASATTTSGDDVLARATGTAAGFVDTGGVGWSGR